MILGVNACASTFEVNPIKETKLTNILAAGKDDALPLTRRGVSHRAYLRPLRYSSNSAAPGISSRFSSSSSSPPTA